MAMRKPVIFYKRRNSGSSGPLDISGLWGWWDMNDLTMMYTTAAGSTHVAADGDLVGRIEDKSGQGHHLTQGTAGTRPTWKANIVGALGAVLHGVGGASKHIQTAGNQPNVDFSVLAVLKCPATITGGTAYGSMTSYVTTTSDGTRDFFIDTDGVLKSNTSPTSIIITDLTPTTNQLLLCTLSIKNTSTRRTMQINNRTAVTDDTAVTSTDNVFSLGRHNTNNTTNFWTGHSCEILLYSPALSAGNMTTARNYLNAKWGVY